MLLDRIAAEVDTRFRNWAFRGSLVDWHYLDGQVMVKDFDIVTADPFEPTYVCDFWGPRMSWKFMGRSIDVFYEADPGPRMQTVEGRIARLKWLIEKIPSKAAKYQAVLARYAAIKGISCHHRGEQVSTVLCDQCGQGKGQLKPVYSCSIHGLCTHRLERSNQKHLDPPIHTCVGCSDGPWAF